MYQPNSPLFSFRLSALLALAALVSACGSSSSGSSSGVDVPQPPGNPGAIDEIGACHESYPGEPNAQWPDITLSASSPKTLNFQWTPVDGASHYRLLKDPDGASGFSQVGEDLTDTIASEEISVHLHAWPNARYLVEACNEQGCQESTVTYSSDAMLGAIGCFKASNAAAQDWFGWSTALSADGRTLAVSALRESVDARGVNGDQDNRQADHFGSGAVYVFVWQEGGWQQQAYIKPEHTHSNHRFGYSLSLSGNGNTLAVGAIHDISSATGVNGETSTEVTTTLAGAAYVFSREQGTWTQDAFIKASNTHAGSFFGSAVALDAEGETLAVSAFAEQGASSGINGDQETLGVANAGAVYLYSLDEQDGWGQQAYIKASNNRSNLRFGHSLALSADGQTLAVGAIGDASRFSGINVEQDNSQAPNSGAVYVFTRDGQDWSQQAYIKASDADTSDHFGASVALSENGNYLAVGAFFAAEQSHGDSGTRERTGAAYVFGRDGAQWAEEARITDENGRPGDWFGNTIALSRAGDLLAVGAFVESSGALGINGDPTDTSVGASGALLVYQREAADWREQAYVKAPVQQPQQRFSQSVSLSADGGVLAVGAYRNASGGTGINSDDAETEALNSGAVFLY